MPWLVVIPSCVSDYTVLPQDIVSLFSHESCPSCVTCEFADNNCWYVTFDSEESTQKVRACLGGVYLLAEFQRRGPMVTCVLLHVHACAGIHVSEGAGEGVPGTAYPGPDKGHHGSEVIGHAQDQTCALQHAVHVQRRSFPGEVCEVRVQRWETHLSGFFLCKHAASLLSCPTLWRVAMVTHPAHFHHQPIL